MHLSPSVWNTGIRLFLDGDESRGGGGSASDSTTEAKDDTKDDIDEIDGLGDRGKDALRKERDAKKAAAARAKAAEEERDALRAEKAEREEAERKAQERAAEEKGEFETLAKTREEERDAAKAEATTLRAENDQFKAAIDTVLKDEWNALEADVLEYYPGTDDDTLARLSWLPKGKALQTKLHPKKGDVLRGNGENPRSSSTTAGDDTTALAMNTRRYG